MHPLFKVFNYKCRFVISFKFISQDTALDYVKKWVKFGFVDYKMLIFLNKYMKCFC